MADSSALAGRFLILRLENSFYGREDLPLTDRPEGAPGHPSLGDRGVEKRPRARGHSLQPATGKGAIEEMLDWPAPSPPSRDWCGVGRRRTPVRDFYDAGSSGGSKAVTTRATCRCSAATLARRRPGRRHQPADDRGRAGEVLRGDRP